VQELIKSALEPVIEQRLIDNPSNPTEALLNIRVIDPACGSGHFLLAAARRLAETLAQLRSQEGVVKPQDYRHALREVVSHCIFGVDRNPMALELARTALWLEGFEEGRPLSFLDHHLQCGDALLGLIDLKVLEYGIPKAAFKSLSGDDKKVCKALNKTNSVGLKQLEKERKCPQFNLPLEQSDALNQLNTLEDLPENTTAEIATKEAAYKAFLQQARNNHLRHAADMLLGAFLLRKTEDSAQQIPTTASLILELVSSHHNEQHRQQRSAATDVCVQTQVFHWPLAFPQVFATGGFDCVLGNPPWEMLQLDPQEFFATRAPGIANAQHMSARNMEIEALRIDNPILYIQYEHELRLTESTQLFIHGSDRFRYSGFGRTNLYALFVETCLNIICARGRIGIITPSGLATDSFTQKLFNHINPGRLISLYDFENRDAIFPSVHRSYKFCLLTLGQSNEAEFSFFLTKTTQLADNRRRFTLSREDFSRINPNTLTSPVFRSSMDAELSRKIYRNVPVLIREACDEKPEQNPWRISFMLMFIMNTASHLFKNKPVPDHLPLYEAKMIHQFDHRWATYEEGRSRDVSLNEKSDPGFVVTPRYWVDATEVNDKLNDKGWHKGWLMGWRDIVLRMSVL